MFGNILKAVTETEQTGRNQVRQRFCGNVRLAAQDSGKSQNVLGILVGGVRLGSWDMSEWAQGRQGGRPSNPKGLLEVCCGRLLETCDPIINSSIFPFPCFLSFLQSWETGISFLECSCQYSKSPFTCMCVCMCVIMRVGTHMPSVNRPSPLCLTISILLFAVVQTRWPKSFWDSLCLHP